MWESVNTVVQSHELAGGKNEHVLRKSISIKK